MGGILGRASRLGRRDEYSGRTIRIHGNSYVFQRRLGTGGFGSVYSARAPNGVNVAIKVIDINRRPDIGYQLVESYLNEVAQLNRLRQETRHVVVIYDFDFDGRTGEAYLVMELGGENLNTLIQRIHGLRHGPGGPGNFIDPIVKKEIWRQMVSIVGTLHKHSIVHMDLKPDNFILFGRILKIADLGIAKKADNLAQSGIGTPFFSAPEVMQDVAGFQRYYGPKADIWSLGAILYYMTYGRPPSYHSGAASAPPPGQFPPRDPDLQDILRRTLHTDPHARADIGVLMRHPYTLR